MTTYVVGTDGMQASEAIRAELQKTVEPGDTLEVVYVLPSADPSSVEFGKRAMEPFEGAFPEDITVETGILHLDHDPARELTSFARDVSSDRIVIATRSHSRTERFVFGSVSHSILEQTTVPVTMVPLESDAE